MCIAEELFQTLLDLSRLPEEGIIWDGDETSEFRTSLPGMGPFQESIKSNKISSACTLVSI